MRTRLGWRTVALAAVALGAPPTVGANLLDSPTFDAAVLQGGFDFENPADDDRDDAGLLSLGPLVAGGVRSRVVIPGGAADVCAETLYLLIGSRGTRRDAKRVTLRQNRHAVVFFVLFRCVDGKDVCVEGASEAVAVAGCAGSVNVRKRGRIVAKAKVRCKRGVDTGDPAFGLSAAERAQIDQAFPELRRALRVRFVDRDANQTTGPDLDFKLRNLTVHALENIVGTYLDDDQLPTCTP